jgi:RNA polymerase sigma-70 factor (ECF subfamily)
MAADQHSDEALMEAYRDGDAGAFDALYERHKGGLFRYILRLCNNPRAAEELFQDVWMNLIGARETYTIKAKFATYLYRLAHNRVIDYYRANKVRDASTVWLDENEAICGSALPAARGHDPAVAFEGREQVERLLRLIAELPHAQREAFLLQQETDMSIEEIAQATQVDRETAKSRLRYAIAKLRQGLQS